MFATLRFAGGFHRVTQGSTGGGLSRMERESHRSRETKPTVTGGQHLTRYLKRQATGDRPFTTAVQPQKRVESLFSTNGRSPSSYCTPMASLHMRATMPAKEDSLASWWCEQTPFPWGLACRSLLEQALSVYTQTPAAPEEKAALSRLEALFGAIVTSGTWKYHRSRIEEKAGGGISCFQFKRC